MECFTCLVQCRRRVGTRQVEIRVAGIVVEIGVSGFRMAKESAWERDGVEMG